MMLRRSLRSASVIIALFGLGGTALAQAACERYRAELASLNRSGAAARNYEAAVQRQQNEIARLSNYYRSIGCERGFFFMQAPPECGSIAHQIRSLQAGYAAIAGQAIADPGAIHARRQQLQAAIARTCDAARVEEPTTSVTATGGSRLVCVRTCDGYFFPIQNDPEGRAKPADLCKALCPNAEVALYRAPQDGGIEQAISESGKPYMQLPNALRYTKAADQNCSCRRPGESWAQTLQKAERMISHKSTDIVVTAAISERLSRATLAGPKMRKGKTKDPVEIAEQAAASRLDVETTGSIVPDGAPAEKPPGQEVGTPARPRVIAPDLIPVPRTQ